MLFELEGPDSRKSPPISVVGQEVLNLIFATWAGLWLLLHISRGRLPFPVVLIDINAHCMILLSVGWGGRLVALVTSNGQGKRLAESQSA